jgi:hypothetical protein
MVWWQHVLAVWVLLNMAYVAVKLARPEERSAPVDG